MWAVGQPLCAMSSIMTAVENGYTRSAISSLSPFLAAPQLSTGALHPSPAQGPTWLSVCAPSARAQPPHSSIRCGCCPACGPPLQSQPATDPWSCWCCSLRRVRADGMVTRAVRLFHPSSSGHCSLVCPHHPATPPVPTLPGCCREKLQRKAARTALEGREARRHVRLPRSGGSGCPQPRGLDQDQRRHRGTRSRVASRGYTIAERDSK